jgi:hypothetical protein
MTLSTAVIITANANQAKAEVRTMHDEMKRLNVQMDGTSTQKFVNAWSGVKPVLSSAAESARAFGAALDLQDEFNRFKASVDPAYAATIRFAQAQDLAKRAVEAGAISQADADLVLQRLGGSLDRVAKANGNMLGGLRNASMQLSQVGQQTMVTGDFVQALAIQLPDLGLSFGVVGAAAGLLGGVALPMVVSMFSGTEEKAQNLDGAMQDLSGSISDYKKYTDLAMTSTAELRIEFGEFAGQVKGFSEYMRGVTLGKSLDDLKATIDPLKGGLSEVVRQMQDVARAKEQISRISGDDPEQLLRAKEALAQFQDIADTSASALGLTAEQAVQLAAAIDAVGTATGMENIRDRAGEALSMLQAMVPNGQQLPGPLREAASALNDMASQTAAASNNLQPAIAYAKDLGERLQYGAHVVLQLAQNEPRPAWLSSAIGSARTLASFLQMSLNAAAGISGLKPSGVSGSLAQQYASYGKGRTSAEGMVGAGHGGATDSRGKWMSDNGLGGSAGSGGSGRSGAASAAKEEADAVGDLIKKLEEERDLARETDPIQREMLKYRKQLAAASKEERARVEELIRAENQLEAARKASDFMASSSLDLLKGLAAGGDQATSAMDRFKDALIDAGLQALWLGKGPLADLLGISGSIFDGLFGGGGGGGGLFGGGGGGLFGGGGGGGGFGKFIGSIFGFTDGGMIFGQGGPRQDKIPLWGSAGEFMVNAKATAQYRPLLERINSGTGIAGFADGGLIGGNGATSSLSPRVNANHQGASAPSVGQVIGLGSLVINAQGAQQGVAEQIDRKLAEFVTRMEGLVAAAVSNLQTRGRL